jgi:plasmid stabilization system protein ParE
VNVSWTRKAVADLGRLYDFLAPVNRRAAARVLQSLTTVAGRLADRARIGEKLQQYEPREVGRLLMGKYEMRCEVQGTSVLVLRLWHTRESR